MTNTPWQQQTTGSDDEQLAAMTKTYIMLKVKKQISCTKL